MTEEIGIYPSLIVFETYDERLKRGNRGYWGMAGSRGIITVFADKVDMVRGLKTVLECRYTIRAGRKGEIEVQLAYDAPAERDLVTVERSYHLDSAHARKVERFVEILFDMAKAMNERAFRYVVREFDRFIKSGGLMKVDFQKLYQEAMGWGK
jgi:hypothetical protein